MKITKYEHACFTVEKDGKLVVVDPGGFTTDLPALESVIAVLVTHAHPDHYDPAALGALIAHNPDAKVYAPADVTRQLGETLPHQTVTPNEVVSLEPFTFEFFGGTHALIHESIETPSNVGVLINDSLYYPGDSFVRPERQVHTLALPIAAPWLKVEETIDYLNSVRPRFMFPTHDAILSDAGKTLLDSLLEPYAEKIGATYKRLHEPIEIDS